MSIACWSFTPSEIIAIGALVTAVCAVAVSVWQGWLSRRHNRLSVRPLLAWRRDRTLSDLGTTLVFKLQNCGFGPAVIIDRYFTLGGARFSIGPPSIDEVRLLANQVLGARLKFTLSQHGLPGIASAIPAGGEFIIASLVFPNSNPEMVDAAIQAAGELSFVVQYESLYGDRRDFRVSTADGSFAA